MSLSPAGQTAKIDLDANLGSSTELINIKMGISLYNEMCACRMITYMPYGRIIFPGHSRSHLTVMGGLYFMISAWVPTSLWLAMAGYPSDAHRT